MKRFIWLIPIFLCCIILSGCSKEAADSEQSYAIAPDGNIVLPDAAAEDTSVGADSSEPAGYVWKLEAFSCSADFNYPKVLHGDGSGGFYVRGAEDDTEMLYTVYHCDANGEVLSSVELPIRGNNEVSIGNTGIVCGNDTIWFDYQVVISSGGGDAVGEYETYIAACDSNGTQVFSHTTDDLFGTYEDTPLLTGMVSVDDSCIISTEHQVIALDTNGNVLWRIDTARTLDNMAVGASGSIYLQTAFDGDDLLTLDVENQSVSEAIFSFDKSYYSIGTGILGYELLLMDNQYETPIVYGFDISSVEMLPLFQAGSLGMYSVGNMVETGSGLLVFDYINLMSGFSFGQLVKSPITDVDDITILTLGVCGTVSATAESAVAMFNTMYPDYYLSIANYEDVEELNLAIVSGDGPDIICFDGLDEEAYARNGQLYDLYQFMDSEIREDLVPEYLQEYEINGALYRIAPVFCYETLCGGNGYSSGALNSFSELYQATAQIVDDETVWYQMTPDVILSELAADSLYRFVDYSSGECDFDSDEFKALLSLCMSKSTTSDAEPLYSFSRYSLTNYDTGSLSNGTNIGFFGSGVLLTKPSDTFGIYANSSDPEAAWGFIEMLLNEDIQRAYSSITGYYPVVSSIYEDVVPAEIQAWVATAAGHKIAVSPLFEIIQDESAYYFSGELSVDSVAEQIQSRARIYLAEQYE